MVIARQVRTPFGHVAVVVCVQDLEDGGRIEVLSNSLAPYLTARGGLGFRARVSGVQCRSTLQCPKAFRIHGAWGSGFIGFGV